MMTFSTFYSKHYSEVVNYISNKLGKDEAEDVAQNVFASIFSNWKNVKQDTIRTYLFRCVKNALIDKYTAKNRKRIYFATVLEDVIEDRHGYVPQSYANPLDILISSEYVAAFKKELDRLPSRQKKIAKLHFIKGMNYREINENTSIPMGTICSQLTRIKKQIRQCV